MRVSITSKIHRRPCLYLKRTNDRRSFFRTLLLATLVSLPFVDSLTAPGGLESIMQSHTLVLLQGMSLYFQSSSFVNCVYFPLTSSVHTASCYRKMRCRISYWMILMGNLNMMSVFCTASNRKKF